MNIQIKEGTKDSQGRVVQLGDTLDCFGYFTRDPRYEGHCCRRGQARCKLT